jgi:hypothetical protein
VGAQPDVHVRQAQSPYPDRRNKYEEDPTQREKRGRARGKYWSLLEPILGVAPGRLLCRPVERLSMLSFVGVGMRACNGSYAP